MKSRFLLPTLGAALALPMIATTATAQDKVDFVKSVLPIFEDNCMKCHREAYKTSTGRTKKPKGDLRMDDPAEFIKGGESGDTLVAGKPDDSEVYKRIILDAEHDDVMPPKDGPLAKDEIELIKKWIAEGTEFGDWKGTKFDAEGNKLAADGTKAADGAKAEGAATR